MTLSLAVTDSSHVADVRRRCVERAGELGLNEQDRGRVAIVATELATNALKHAAGGELLLDDYELGDTSGIELCCLDRGQGMSNVEACLTDGFSTAGTAGNGLGAVQRQTQFLRIASWPGAGTAVLCRVEKAPRRDRPPPTERGWAGLALSKPGEQACGDAFSVADTDGGRTLIVADGLGHGSEAAAASGSATQLFQRNRGQALPQILALLHAGMRAGRGAAISLARFDPAGGRVTFCGIGNVAGVLISDGQSRRMISMPGTVGHNMRKVQSFDYVLNDGVVVVHSDGLTSSWQVARYPGLTRLHPSLIAAILYRDFARGIDDVGVLVASVGAA